VSAAARAPSDLGAGDIAVSIHSVKGADSEAMRVRAVIEAPAAKVWEIIEDCDRYESTFDHIASARLLRRSGAEWTCEVTFDMPFPMSDLRAVTRAKHTERKGYYERRWHLLSGDYDYYEGYWRVELYKGSSTRTLVTYHAHVVPSMYVPGWVERRIRTTGPPKMIKRLRAEVAALP